MKNNVLFRSQNGIMYMYSYKNKEYVIVLAVLKIIIMLKQQGMSDQDVLLAKELNDFSKDVIERYLKKYYFYINTNFLTNEDVGTKKFGRLNAHIIDQQIDNLSVLTFEVTDRCNLRCRYCAYGDMYDGYDERNGSDMSFSMAKTMLDYLFVRWGNSVSHSPERTVSVGFYGGEPLVNFELIKQIIYYIEQKYLSNIKFVFNMTTNALLLDKYIDYIVEHDLKLLISLDGTEADNCHRITVANKNSFSIVYSNLKFVQQKYPDFFKKNVAFNSVFHAGSDVDRIVKFFKDEFDKSTSLSELNNSGIKNNEQYSQIQKSVFTSIASSPKNATIDRQLMYNSPRISVLTYFLHHLTNEVVKDYRALLYGNKKYSLLSGGTCIPFERKMYITVNGRILVCERIDHDYSVGHISDQGVKLDSDRIARKYNLYYKKVGKQCKECYMQYSCSQCMFYLNMKDKNITCYSFKSANDFAVYLSLNVSYMENNPWSYKKVMNEITIF